jgi:hypothetical protein
MAEEILLKEPLTDEMIQGGAELTLRLDERNWPVLASFWNFQPERNSWTLTIASPRVTIDGRLAAYEAIRDALNSLQHRFTTLKTITAMQPNHPLVRALATVARTGKKIEGKRFWSQRIEDRWVDDIYLYRLMPEAAAA